MIELALRSLSGTPLVGDRLVRFAYLDEAGVSNPKQEPILVVAGVLVHADTKWKPLERRLRSLAQECVPAEHLADFRFHAKDLFHGSGFFPRDKWSMEDRFRVLEELATLPAEFDLPVVYGAVELVLNSQHDCQRTGGICEVVPENRTGS